MAHGARPGAGRARGSARRRQRDRGLRSLSGTRHADRREDRERLDRRRRDPEPGRRDARRAAFLERRRAGRPRAAFVTGAAGPCRAPGGCDARARGPVGSAAARRTEVPSPVGGLDRSSPRAARATPRRRAHQCQHGKRGRGARSPATRPPARRSGRSLRRPCPTPTRRHGSGRGASVRPAQDRAGPDAAPEQPRTVPLARAAGAVRNRDVARARPAAHDPADGRDRPHSGRPARPARPQGRG